MNTIEKKKVNKKEVKEIVDIMRKLPATFQDTLIFHMSRVGISVELLEERSLVNVKTLQRMRNDYKYKAKLSVIVAVCIGLKLDPLLSYDLINKSTHRFIIDEEHIIYQRILNYYYNKSIYECNEILKVNNFYPLIKSDKFI